MANQTANYHLTKPLASEHYDVEVQNSNMDKLDAALSELAKQTGGGGGGNYDEQIADSYARLDVLEEAMNGVSVPVTVTDELNSDQLLSRYCTLTVSGATISQLDTSTPVLVTGGYADISATMRETMQRPRTVTVNGTVLGSIGTVGDSVSTRVKVTSGSEITVAFTIA